MDDDSDVAEGSEYDGFDRPRLGPHWSTLRRPAAPDWLSLTDRSSHLRIHGGRSPQSLIEPSLVARRVTAANCTFEATIDYQPLMFQHLAGVAAYYNTRNWHFLYLTADDSSSPVLSVATRDRGTLTVHSDAIRLPDIQRLRLGIDFDGPDLAFRYNAGAGWRTVGATLNATILSDEHAAEFDGGHIRALGFTGAFVGLWVWDLTGNGHHADFEDTNYLPTR
jgi:xylan 1,4-beta-xylosidase